MLPLRRQLNGYTEPNPRITNYTGAETRQSFFIYIIIEETTHSQNWMVISGPIQKESLFTVKTTPQDKRLYKRMNN